MVSADIELGEVGREQTSGSSVIRDSKVTLRFRDVRRTVGKGDNKKEILKGISGLVRPGEIMAILGPSGAGKTTLLNCLAGRSKADEGSEILCNGEPINVRTDVAYVTQDDLLFANLTVFEQLKFSAMMRLPGDLSDEEKLSRAIEVMGDLGIGHTRDTLIGGELVKGVSGGERKRVNIATELLTDPSVVFLDEPTSGLDSHTAVTVFSLLHHLASQNRTIITTIHQPSSVLFSMFDKVMILAQGRVMYAGRADQAVNFFSKLGYNCPRYSNPAEFLLDLCFEDTEQTDRQKQFRRQATSMMMVDQGPSDSTDLAETSGEAKSAPKLTLDERLDLFAEETGRRVSESVDRDEVDGMDGVERRKESIDQSMNDGSSFQYSASFFTQVRWLMWRSFIKFSRNRQLFNGKIFQGLAIAILVGVVFLQLDCTSVSTQDRIGVLFFITINQTFSPILGILNTFPSERAVVLKERDSKSYRASAYFIAKTLAELPLQLVEPTILAALIWAFAGLGQECPGFDVDSVPYGVTQTEWESVWVVLRNLRAQKFFTFLATVYSLNLVAVSFGTFVSGITKEQTVGILITAPMILVFILFGGLFANSESIPVGLVFLEVLSFIKYGYNIIVTNEFTNHIINPATDEPFGMNFCSPPGAPAQSCDPDTSAAGTCVCQSGLEQLSFLGMLREVDPSDVNNPCQPGVYDPTNNYDLCYQNPEVWGPYAANDTSSIEPYLYYEEIPAWQNFLVLFSMAIALRFLAYLAVRFYDPRER